MIRFRKYQMKGGALASKGLWYARPVVSETLDIEALAQHMSDHNTPFSPGVIKGVLTDMVGCIKELILDGKNVKLDDLAIFSCGIMPKKGATSAESFKVTENVKGVRLRARATGDLSIKALNLEATLREQALYAFGAASPTGTGPKPVDKGTPQANKETKPADKETKPTGGEQPAGSEQPKLPGGKNPMQ